MSQPPKSTMRAPRLTCRSYKGVRLPKNFSKDAPHGTKKKGGEKWGHSSFPSKRGQASRCLDESDAPEVRPAFCRAAAKRGMAPSSPRPSVLEPERSGPPDGAPHPFGG